VDVKAVRRDGTPDAPRERNGATMAATVSTRQRMRITLAVLRALLAWRDLDYVSLWWIARCASTLSRTEMRSAFGEALDLVAAIRLAEANACEGCIRSGEAAAGACLSAPERSPHAN